MVMGNILKIDKFSNVSKSLYGLEANGNCYTVKEPFYLEAIIFYDKDFSGEIPKLSPSWAKLKAEKGDIISVTNEGCYIELNDYPGYIECRPETLSDKESPKFDKFPEDNLVKIGQNLLKCKPMTFEERKNVSMIRV